MKITIIIDDNEAPDLDDIRQSLNNLQEDIMVTKEEFAAKIDNVTAQLSKTKVEIQAEIDGLKAAVDNAGINDAGVQAAFARLTGKVQELDDLNPDQAAGG